MSILLGYDYPDTAVEDLNTLRQELLSRIAAVERGQQGNAAGIAKHTDDIAGLNSLGKKYTRYGFLQIPGLPAGFLNTSLITDTDKKDARFMVFKVSGYEINYSTPSPPYGFYEGSIGTVVMFTVNQRSAIIRTSFSFAVEPHRDYITIEGLEFRNIDSAGNATIRSEATTIKCFLMTA
jgi:hypothetical protein